MTRPQRSKGPHVAALVVVGAGVFVGLVALTNPASLHRFIQQEKAALSTTTTTLPKLPATCPTKGPGQYVALAKGTIYCPEQERPTAPADPSIAQINNQVAHTSIQQVTPVTPKSSSSTTYTTTTKTTATTAAPPPTYSNAQILQAEHVAGSPPGRRP